MSSLVSDTFGLRPDEPIAASTGLETPQIVVRWRLDDPRPDIDEIKLRRSLYRFPESITEGDAVLDEVQDNSNVRTSFADLTPAPDKVHYYSLFFVQKGPFSMTLDSSFDTERLGTIRSLFTRTGTTKYWLLSRKEAGGEVIWSYNTLKSLVEESIDLSKIIDVSVEQSVSIVDFTTGVTRSFSIATTKRFIQFTISLTATEVLPSDITNQFNWLGVLNSGFIVDSGTLLSGDVIVLDTGNLEVKRVTTLGAVVSTMSLSSLNLTGSFNGISADITFYYIGSGKVIYAIDNSLVTPLNNDVMDVYPVRQNLKSGFTYDITNGRILLVDNDLQEFQRYSASSFPVHTQMEEQTLPQTSVFGIWRLEESSGSVVDSSGYGNAGTVVGAPTRGVAGKFGNSIQFVTAADAVNFATAPSDFDLDDGYYSFWWKSPYLGFRAFTTAKTLFIATDGGSTNLSKVEALTNGDLRVTITRSGTAHTITYVNGQAAVDDGIFHHFLVTWSGGAGGTAFFYVDDILVGSVVMTMASAAVTAMSLGLAGSSFIGFYDDLSFGAGSTFTRFTRYTLTTRGSRAWALSGRDYTEKGQHWRDKLRLEFGEYILRNDFDISTLPQNKELADGEEILRQTASELTLGNVGKLSRLFGLLLDRVTDYRRSFMDHLNSRTVEFELIDELGELINAIDINEEWNAEVRRRFLEVMFFCYHRSGTLDAFCRLTRFLGFRLLKPDDVVGTLVRVYRRFFDSVPDPERVDVPFDTITFDSGDDFTQFVDILCKFFIQNRMSAVGSTSIPATRELTDLSALFLTQAEPGSMIIINDQDTPGDDGQYIITSVTSNTVVVVDRDWPVGSLSPLQYRLHWRVPVPDPHNDMLLTRLNTIKVRWQNLLVTL